MVQPAKKAPFWRIYVPGGLGATLLARGWMVATGGPIAQFKSRVSAIWNLSSEWVWLSHQVHISLIRIVRSVIKSIHTTEADAGGLGSIRPN